MGKLHWSQEEHPVSVGRRPSSSPRQVRKLSLLVAANKKARRSSMKSIGGR